MFEARIPRVLAKDSELRFVSDGRSREEGAFEPASHRWLPLGSTPTLDCPERRRTTLHVGTVANGESATPRAELCAPSPRL